jgi:hypothetical protein
MTSNALWSGAWIAAIVNHVWQSTLFVLIAWLITMALKKYQARARYWIWMTATAKFLIPFSILISIGERLQSSFSPHGQSSIWGVAMKQIEQKPFLQSSSAAITIVNDKIPSMTNHLGAEIALVLAALWLCGGGSGFRSSVLPNLPRMLE